MKPSQEGPTHEPHGPQIQVGWLGWSEGKFYDYADHDEVKRNNPGGYAPIYIDQGD